jgi:hypothetical protein
LLFLQRRERHEEVSMVRAVVLLLVVGAGIPTTVSAQQDPTRDLAQELANRLGGTESRALAAPVPDDPSRFVAALHIPGAQLLVISATYQAPSLLRELIARNDDRQVYLDLNAAGDRKGRFFVEDLRVDGLRPDREPNAPFDITWRDAVTRTLYNGNWKEQQLSETEYRARFARDASDYAQMLKVLLSAHAARPTAVH